MYQYPRNGLNSNCFSANCFCLSFIVLSTFSQLCNLPERCWRKRGQLWGSRDIPPRPISFRSKPLPREAKARKRDFFSNFSHKHVSTMLAINFLALANPEKEKKGWLCRWMKTRFWGCTKEMNSVQILSPRRDKKKIAWRRGSSSYPSFWWH